MKVIPKILKFICMGIMISILSSCYFFRKSGSQDEVSSAALVGESLGLKAGGLDEAALELVYDVSTSYPAAAIRPDPDTVVRNLLLEYREAGSVVAREIGRVERFRLLLGGASQDFTIVPQETYDATSLLAKLKVAEEVCASLVAPNEDQHPGWETILPDIAENTTSNVKFLAQRLTGLPYSEIYQEDLDSLETILATAVDEDGLYSLESYIPVCATLMIDARFLLF